MEQYDSPAGTTEPREKPLNSFFNAFGYGFSNITAIVAWGLIISIFLAPMVLVVVAEELYMITDSGTLLTFMIFSFLFLLIGLVLVAGFCWQCIRDLLAGKNTVPKGFDDVPALINNGARVTIILGETIIIGIISLALVVVLPLFAGVSRSSSVFFCCLFPLSLLPFIIIMFMGAVQVVIFTDSGSLRQGLNLLKSCRLILSQPKDAIITIILIYLLGVIFNVFSTIAGLFSIIPLISIIILVIVECLAIAESLATIYMVVRFYQRCTAVSSRTSIAADSLA